MLLASAPSPFPLDIVFPLPSCFFSSPPAGAFALLACGGYRLKDANTQTKEGAILTYWASHDQDSATWRLDHCSTVSCSGGLFDLTLAHDDTLWAADSEGAITQYDNKLNRIRSLTLDKEDMDIGASALSVSCSGPSLLVCSSSSGRVAAFDRATGERTTNAKPHALEAWVARVAYDGTSVLSGSDDSLLCLTDLRSLSTSTNRHHAAGVTLIERMGDPYILTGSYDEHMRIFDIRMLTRPPVCSLRLPGCGPWRAHPLPLSSPASSGLWCVAAMYGGMAIVDVNTNEMKIKQIVEHESLVYGAHSVAPPLSCRSSLFTSCSFYSPSLALWAVDLQQDNKSIT